MKKFKIAEIIEKANQLAENRICHHGIDNAERIVKLALEKIRAQKMLLEKKYEKGN